MFEGEKQQMQMSRKRVLLLTGAGAAFLLFSVLYIVQVNAASTKAFTLRDLEKRHEQLTRENDRLAAEIDRLRSMSSLMERQVFLGLVPVASVKYVHVSGGELAMTP